MKSTNPIIITALALASSAVADVKGFDVSNNQESVDFNKAYTDGARFVIIKATQGTDFIDPKFNKYYTDATNAKLIRGPYHFAEPGNGKGADQANYFLQHGGKWSNDGITLPGMIDLEALKNHPTCFGLSPADMTAWITDFAETYHTATSRYPMIYTNRGWWQSCTGDSAALKDKCPLVLASWGSEPGAIPGGWGQLTIWQYSNSSAWGGDADSFNGDETQLKKLATG